MHIVNSHGNVDLVAPQQLVGADPSVKTLALFGLSYFIDRKITVTTTLSQKILTEDGA